MIVGQQHTVLSPRPPQLNNYHSSSSSSSAAAAAARNESPERNCAGSPRGSHQQPLLPPHSKQQSSASPPPLTRSSRGSPAHRLVLPASNGDGQGFQQLQDAIAWFVSRRAQAIVPPLDAQQHSQHSHRNAQHRRGADGGSPPTQSSPQRRGHQGGGGGSPNRASADADAAESATTGVDGAFFMLAKFIRTFFVRQDALRNIMRATDAVLPEEEGPTQTKHHDHTVNHESGGGGSDVHRSFEVVVMCCGVVLQQMISIAGSMTEASQSLHTIQSALEVVGHHLFVDPPLLPTNSAPQQHCNDNIAKKLDDDPLGRRRRESAGCRKQSTAPPVVKQLTRIQHELDRHFGKQQRLQRHRAYKQEQKRQHLNNDYDDPDAITTPARSRRNASTMDDDSFSGGGSRASSSMSSYASANGSPSVFQPNIFPTTTTASSTPMRASARRASTVVAAATFPMPQKQAAVHATLPEVLGLPSLSTVFPPRGSGEPSRIASLASFSDSLQKKGAAAGRSQVQTAISAAMQGAHYDEAEKMMRASAQFRTSLTPLVPLVAVLSTDPMCHLPTAFAELEATQAQHRVVSLWERSRASRWERQVLRNVFTAWHRVAHYEATQHNAIAELQRNLAHARQTADEKIRLSKQAQARLSELQTHTDRDRQELLRERELEKQDYYVLRVKVTEQAEEIESLNQRVDHLEAKRVFLTSELQRKDAKLQQYFHQSRRTQQQQHQQPHHHGSGASATAIPANTNSSLGASLLSPVSPSPATSLFHYCPPEQLEYDVVDDGVDAGPLMEEMLEMVEEFVDSIAPIPKKCYTFRNLATSMHLHDNPVQHNDDDNDDDDGGVAVTVDSFEDLVTMLVQRQQQRVRAVAEAQLNLSDFSSTAIGGGGGGGAVDASFASSRGPTPVPNNTNNGNSSGGEDVASSRIHSAIGKNPVAGPLSLDGDLQHVDNDAGAVEDANIERRTTTSAVKDAKSPDPTTTTQLHRRSSTVASSNRSFGASLHRQRSPTTTPTTSSNNRRGPGALSSSTRNTSSAQRKRSLSNVSSAMATPRGTSLEMPFGGTVDANTQRSIVEALVIDSHQYAPQWLQMLCYMLSQQRHHDNTSSSTATVVQQGHAPTTSGGGGGLFNNNNSFPIVQLLDISGSRQLDVSSVSAAGSGGEAPPPLDELAKSNTCAPSSVSLDNSVAGGAAAAGPLEALIASCMGDVRSVVAALWKTKLSTEATTTADSVLPSHTTGRGGAHNNKGSKAHLSPASPSLSGSAYQTGSGSRAPHPPAQRSVSSHSNHPQHGHSSSTHHHHPLSSSSSHMAEFGQLLGEALSSTRVFCREEDRMAVSASVSTKEKDNKQATTTTATKEKKQPQPKDGNSSSNSSGLPAFCEVRDEPARIATLRRRIREAWLRGSSAERLLKFLAVEFLNANRREKLAEDGQALRRLEASSMSAVSSMAASRGPVGGIVRRAFGSMSRRPSTLTGGGGGGGGGIGSESGGGGSDKELDPPPTGTTTRRGSVAAAAVLAATTTRKKKR